MDIGNVLRKTWRDEVTIRSVFSNTISKLYNKPVEIISVRLQSNTICIKTGNPLINSELQLIKSEILENSKSKLEKIWIRIPNQDTIKFL